MKILLLCAKAFETLEFSAFVDVMGWATEDFQCNISIDKCGFQKIVTSTFGVSVIMDVLIDDINVEEYDALAIPGGFREFGFNEEAFDVRTLDLIKKFDYYEKPIASVCVAAFAIAESGVLKGRNATTYHLDNGKTQGELAQYGINIINEPVVIDKNIITSYCPETAPEVAFKLLEMLTNTEKMQQVKGAMGYN